MPIKPIKLELGVFTKDDEERMWEQLRKVWRREEEGCGCQRPEISSESIVVHRGQKDEVCPNCKKRKSEL